jgi:hypothetical protein
MCEWYKNEGQIFLAGQGPRSKRFLALAWDQRLGDNSTSLQRSYLRERAEKCRIEGI